MLSSSNNLLRYLVKLDRIFPLLTTTAGSPVPYNYEPVHGSLKYDIGTTEVALEALLEELKSVEEARSEVKSRISAYRTHLQSLRVDSPIGRLPNEILARIFAFAIDGHIRLDHHPIWTIRCVCARWRWDILQCTPSFWRKIEVESHSWFYNRSNILMHRLLLCLGISDSAPLDIKVEPPQMQIYFPIWGMEAIAQHCDRWESIEFGRDILEAAMAQTNFSKIIAQKGLPKVRKLVIDALEDPNFNGDCMDAPFHIFQSAVSLEELHLYGIDLPDPLTFPSQNIRKLVIYASDGTISNRRFRSLLLAMPLFEKLTWCGCFGDKNWIATSSISAPSLRSLSLRRWADEVDYEGREDEDDDPLLPWLLAPNLTNVKIDGNILEAKSLISIVRRSGSIIKSLKIRGVSFMFAQRLFKEFPHIAKLSMDDSENILDLLITETHVLEDCAEDRTLLPSLRQLTLSGWRHIVSKDTNNDSLSMLMSIMRTRSPVSRLCATKQIEPLLCIRIVKSRIVEDDELWIRQLRSLGDDLGIKIEVGSW